MKKLLAVSTFRDDTHWRLWLAYLGLSMAAVAAAVAAPTAEAQTAPSGSHPFAQHFLALQISSSDHTRQTHIISVAQNVLKHYGPDKVAIDVVAFGPGVHLLYADSPLRRKVESLITEGVRFDVCKNTLDTITRKSGHRPQLVPHVHLVQAGVPRLMTLAQKGYVIIQP